MQACWILLCVMPWINIFGIVHPKILEFLFRISIAAIQDTKITVRNCVLNDWYWWLVIQASISRNKFNIMWFLSTRLTPNLRNLKNGSAVDVVLRWATGFKHKLNNLFCSHNHPPDLLTAGLCCSIMPSPTVTSFFASIRIIIATRGLCPLAVNLCHYRGTCWNNWSCGFSWVDSFETEGAHNLNSRSTYSQH